MSDIEAKLKELDKKIRECRYCAHREQFPDKLPTFQIKLRNNILFVGRDPAKNGWRKSGKAFFRPDGKMILSGIIFSKQLKKVGASIEEINFVELLKCFPHDGKLRPPKKDEIKNCRKWLISQINIIQPAVIVPMGKEPTEFFLEKTIKMGDVAGKRFDWQGFSVIPIFHTSPANPANMKSNPKNVKILKEIFKKFG